MTQLSRRSILVGASALALSTGTVFAAPGSNLLDPHWQPRGNQPGPDHSALSSILSTYARRGAAGVNLIDYAGLAGPGRATLNAYVAQLEAATPSQMSRDAAMAYWINLYNAKTLQVVVDEYPVRSIKQVRGGLFNTGPWNDKVSTVEGRALSLNDMEHGILRPIWNNDPRIHYAVNCASIGCPNLALKPYTAASLETMLEDAARDYINHPRGALVSGGRLQVSSIYSWYTEDFGNSEAGVISHLKKYAGPQLASALNGVTRISGDDYDWDLNGF